MGVSISSHASIFEKVLAAFETGGITYTDVLAQVRRLLATEASPTELLEILRRRELIEPLPKTAHEQITELLTEALAADGPEQNAPEPIPDAAGTRPSAPQSVTPPPTPAAVPAETVPELPSDTTRVAILATDLAVARTALESEQLRLHELERALAESAASNEAGRLRTEEMHRKLERYQTEFRTLREAVAARDAAVNQLKQAVRDRDAQITALSLEQTALVPSIEAQQKAHARLEEDLGTARASVTALEFELAEARSALGEEKTRARDAGMSLAESAASAEGARSKAEKVQRELQHFQIELQTLRTAHSALQQEHADALPALKARTLESAQTSEQLVVARAQLETAGHDLQSSQDSVASLRSQLEHGESLLTTARQELVASRAQARSYLELLQTREWRGGAEQNQVRDLDAQVASAYAERSAVVEQRDRLQVEVLSLRSQLEPASVEAASVEPASVGPATAASTPEVLLPPSLPIGPAFANTLRGAGRTIAEGWDQVRKGRLPGGRARSLGLLAAVIAVVVVVWSLFHLASAPPQVSTSQAVALPETGATIRDCPTCPPVTVLPQGRFKQGSARGDSSSAASEKPQHWVLIGRALGMTTSVVTVEEFRQFAAATGRDMQGCDVYDVDWQHSAKNSWTNPGFEQTGHHPVTCASWNDAQAYAQWLSATSGHRYRLPSASEWEYAARSGMEASQPWGGDGADACANANVADRSAGRRYPGWMTFACDDGFVNTSPIGSFKANAFGLQDMLGNVFQWTEDCWHADYNGAPIDGSARMDGNCSEHELRGGSWFTAPSLVRSNYRNHFGIDYRTSTVGIRLVRELD